MPKSKKSHRKPPQTLPRPSRDRGMAARAPSPIANDRLGQFHVGDIVTGLVTEVLPNKLWVDINGMIGVVHPGEWPLPTGEMATDLYKTGDTVQNLFVSQIDRESRNFALSIRRNAPGYLNALDKHLVGDIITGFVTDVLPDSLWVDINGMIGVVHPGEWPLPTGEMATDLYKTGDTVQNLFVSQIDRESRILALSIRRNAPGYLNALDRHLVGTSVSGTVTSVSQDSLWMNIDGVIGVVPPSDWPLLTGEMATDLYKTGDTVQNLFVSQIDRETRNLALSIRRNAPGYLNSLDNLRVGVNVSGTATSVLPDSLVVNVGDVIGIVPAGEWPLPTGETATDLYKTGDIMQNLFISHIDRETRDLLLSIRRNAPGYLDVLDKYPVGTSVSGKVTSVLPDMLWVDINGVIGVVHPGEWPLPTGEMATDLYKTGDTVQNLFVSQIDRESRDLALSIRRNAPSYLNALDRLRVGYVVSGTVTSVLPNTLWVDINGVIGAVPASEWPLPTGEMATDLYKTGDTVQNLFVWQIDRESGMIILSNQSRVAELKSHVVGTTIKAVVQGSRIGGINVLVASTSVFIPNHELDCLVERQLRFKPNTEIDVVVLDVSDDGLANRLSHRRTLDVWADQIGQFASGVLVPNAVIIPKAAMPDDEQRVAVDLGPITGFIRKEELGPDSIAEFVEFEANHQHGVVIESVDHQEGSAIVSLENFDARWQELADGISENNECDGVLRQISRSIAVFDLGSGLLGEMAWEPRPGAPAIVSFEDIGKTIPVRVTAIDRVGHFMRIEHRDQEIHQFIMKGESQSLEFKSSLRRSPRSGENDSGASYGVLKSIAGFLNSWDGGTLIIGMDDAGTPIIGAKGAIGAMAVDGYADEDEMLRALKDQIKNRISTSVFDLLDISFVHYRDTRIICVNCSPAKEETWLKGGRSGKSKEEEFFLRMPASTDRLVGRDLVDFVKQRFGGRGRPEVTSRS